MEKKVRYCKEVKLKAINEYQLGIKSVNQIANELGCDKKSFREWLINYISMGEIAFDEKQGNKAYSKELKMNAISDYINGVGSLEDIARKYQIYSKKTLRDWIKKYNGHIEIKDYNPKGEIYMTKSKKTTFEERLEIVKYYLEHEQSYKLAAEHFGQPYSQVYQWVNKYLEQGEQGLQDRRGRNKSIEELSEVEKFNRQKQIYEAQIERLKMEKEVLKKAIKLEGGWELTKRSSKN